MRGRLVKSGALSVHGQAEYWRRSSAEVAAVLGAEVVGMAAVQGVGIDEADGAQVVENQPGIGLKRLGRRVAQD
jgi:hypothetical protein